MKKTNGCYNQNKELFEFYSKPQKLSQPKSTNSLLKLFKRAKTKQSWVGFMPIYIKNIINGSLNEKKYAVHSFS